jgi:hypothetical protein
MKMPNINFGKQRLIFIAAAGCALSLSGCFSAASLDTYAEKRRQTLLILYPVGKTTQKDVEAKWSKGSRVISATRPHKGWGSHEDPWVKRFGPKAEKRTGRKIAELERYFGPDGFFSLCYCWYYYDKTGRLIDAEWEWSSD